MILFQDTSLTVCQSVLYQTNSTIIETDNLVIVVDPTWLPSEIQKIQQLINEQHSNKAIYLFFTHSDYDHILGYEAFPEAKVIASKAFVERQDKQKILQQITQFDDEYYIQRPYPITYPEVDILINKDEHVIEEKGLALHFFKAAGHTSCGLFLVIPQLGIWIAGDYLSKIEFPFIYDSLTNYEQTLRIARKILGEFPVKIMIPGHGDLCHSKAEILNRIEESEIYLKDLKDTSEEHLEASTNKWTQRYPFPKGLAQSHIDNWKLVHQNS